MRSHIGACRPGAAAPDRQPAQAARHGVLIFGRPAPLTQRAARADGHLHCAGLGGAAVRGRGAGRAGPRRRGAADRRRRRLLRRRRHLRRALARPRAQARARRPRPAWTPAAALQGTAGCLRCCHRCRMCIRCASARLFPAGIFISSVFCALLKGASPACESASGLSSKCWSFHV